MSVRSERRNRSDKPATRAGDTSAGPAFGGAEAAESVEVVNREGAAPFLIVCEHASNHVPAEFDTLGLDPTLLQSHIAWDPGARAVAEAMADILDAPLVAGRVSRLVYDLNRPPEAESAMPAVSEVFRIPGNEGLSETERRARAARFYEPFRRAVAGLIDSRLAAGREVVLVTVHSFTPVFRGEPRRTEIGVLHDADPRLADALIRVLTARGSRLVERNRPYGPEDGVTHTLREHALPRGLANVMLEIRNDLIADPAAQAAMGEWLAGALEEARAALGVATEPRMRSAGRPGGGR